VARTRQPGVRGSGQHLVAESLFAMLAVVLTTALVVGSLRAGTALEEPEPAITSPSAPATTTVAPTSTVGTARTMGGSNLLVDPGFEAGLAGWRPIAGARLERATPPRRGHWAASLTSTAAADQGMVVRGVLRCKPPKTYAATAWVRASNPGMLVEVNLLEYVHGRRYATDTVAAFSTTVVGSGSRSCIWPTGPVLPSRSRSSSPRLRHGQRSWSMTLQSLSTRHHSCPRASPDRLAQLLS
jgi:hypothetical protein